MTDLATLVRNLEQAKATDTEITLSHADLSLMLQFASLIGEPSRTITPLIPTVAEAEPAPSLDLISITEIEETLQVGSHTLWRQRKRDKTFPKPIRPSARKKLFLRTEFNAWLLSHH